MKTQPFIHLHHHSGYSNQDGIGYPKDIIENCMEKGFKGIALTEHGNMDSGAEFYLENQNIKNFKQIWGCEFYICKSVQEKTFQLDFIEKNKGKYSSNEIKQMRTEIRKLNHIILLAKNKTGLENLNQLTYQAYKNFYYKPRIDIDLIKKYNNGVICLSGCVSGYINNIIEDEEEIGIFKNIFKDDLFFELQINELQMQKDIDKKIIKYSKIYDIPFVYTNDGHYLNKGDHKAQETFLMMGQKKTVSNKTKFIFETLNLYIKTADDIKKEIKSWEFNFITKNILDRAFDNSMEIMNKVDDIKINIDVKLMKFKNSFQILEKECKKSLAKNKFGKIYKDRLAFELKVIKQKNLSDYFLLVSDITKKMNKEMLLSAGRGSGAGSLVNYLMDIIKIDPIKFNLYFERFISIDRKDIPDIDLDFQFPERAKEYIKEKYGEDSVATISTYGTFKLKNLIKDISRVWEAFNYQELNQLTKELDRELKTLKESKEYDDLDNLLDYDFCYDKLKSFRNIVDIAKIKCENFKNIFKALYGQIRYIGKHPSGVIVCKDLSKMMPLKITGGDVVTPYPEGGSKLHLKELGFVKIDILGLTTLSILNYVIEKNKINKDDLLKIDIDDKKVYKFIYDKLNLNGIFQFETDLMRGLSKRLKPEVFNDLCLLNAIARPGTLHSGITDELIKRKSGLSKIKNYHKETEKILSDTYGLMVYQENVMEILNKLGGFDMSIVDTIRKLLSKKDKDGINKINKYEKEFIKGCLNKKMTKENSKNLWNEIVEFTQYSFNKAHAVSYSMLAYWCSYLKTYYLDDFYVALFNFKKEDLYKNIKSEAEANGLKFAKININECEIDFYSKKKTIFFGLSKIKGIGDKASLEIYEQQTIEKFTSIEDFFNRPMNWTIVNKLVIEILIKLGAFDTVEKEMNSKQLFELYKSHYQKTKKRVGGMLASHLKKELKKIDDYTESKKQEFENLYLSCNWTYMIWDYKRVEKIKSKLKPFDEFQIGNDLLYIHTIKEVYDKNGDLMAFIEGSDRDGIKRNITVFSTLYKKNIELNNIYVVFFKKNDRGLQAMANRFGKCFLDFKKIKLK